MKHSYCYNPMDKKNCCCALCVFAGVTFFSLFFCGACSAFGVFFFCFIVLFVKLEAQGPKMLRLPRVVSNLRPYAASNPSSPGTPGRSGTPRRHDWNRSLSSQVSRGSEQGQGRGYLVCFCVVRV